MNSPDHLLFASSPAAPDAASGNSSSIPVDLPVRPSIAADVDFAPAASDELAPPTAVRMLLSKELFGSSREVCIAHRGALYRLRITMQNRLILQK